MMYTVDGWAQVYERPCRSQCWKPICHFPSRVRNTIHAPGDFCVLHVQVDRNHEKIFFVFTMLQIREHKKQHLKYNIYKQSHGSAEIRSLYHVGDRVSKSGVATRHLQVIAWFC